MNDSPAMPLSASADGKLNAYFLPCHVVGQQMNYAACLNRIKCIGDGTAPSDWKNSCGGACPASAMRREEELAGKSLYFKARAVITEAADTAREWISSWSSKGKGKKAAPAKPKGSSMFDAMGEVGSMADVVNSMTATKPERAAPSVLVGVTAGISPLTAPPYVRPTMPAALPGETPLQMARRLAAAKTEVSS